MEHEFGVKHDEKLWKKFDELMDILFEEGRLHLTEDEFRTILTTSKRLMDEISDALAYTLRTSKIDTTQKKLIMQDFAAALDRRVGLSRVEYDLFIKKELVVRGLVER